MTATTTPAPAVPAEARLRFDRIVRSEFIKLTSLRSTNFSLAAIAVAGLGASLALAFTMESAGVPSEPSAVFTLWTVTFGTVLVGQLVAAVLGVLAISGEYSTGTIQSTLVAVPVRLPVLAAKALVLFALVTGTALVTVFGSWAATFPLFSALGIQVGMGAPGFALGLVGAAVYLGLIAVFGLGVGALLRSAAGGIATVVGILLLVPTAFSLIGGSIEWIERLWPYLLSNAGESMSKIAESASAPAPTAPLGFAAAALTVLAWTAVSLASGAVALRGRDA